LEVLPAAFYLPAESFSSQDISFEGYYNRMPPGRIDRIPTEQQNVLSLSLPFPYRLACAATDRSPSTCDQPRPHRRNCSPPPHRRGDPPPPLFSPISRSNRAPPSRSSLSPPLPLSVRRHGTPALPRPHTSCLGSPRFVQARLKINTRPAGCLYYSVHSDFSIQGIDVRQSVVLWTDPSRELAMYTWSMYMDVGSWMRVLV
jgi:hypothetical protein